MDQTTAPNRPSFNRFNEEPRQQAQPPPRTTTPAPFRRPPPPPSPPRRPPPPPPTRAPERPQPPRPTARQPQPPRPTARQPQATRAPERQQPPRQPPPPARQPPRPPPTRAPARGSPTARGTTEATSNIRRPDPSQVETRLPNFSFFPVREQLGGANNNDFPSPARPSPQIPERLVPNEPAVENNRPRARVPQQVEPEVQRQPPPPPRQPPPPPARQPPPRQQPEPEINVRPRAQESETSPFTAFRNFPQFPRTPAPNRDIPENQFASGQDNNPRFVEERPRQQQQPRPQQTQARPEPRPEPRPEARPEPPRQPEPVPQRPEPIQNIFGNQNNQQSFTLGPPFTAFNNFQAQPQQQQFRQPQQQQQSIIPPQQQQFQNPPPPPPQQQQFQTQPQQNFNNNPQAGRSTGLGFDGVRNTVVHDSGSQSSSFFSFQRPEFNRPEPTRFPAAQRPSPVNNGAFFGGFPNLGQFVDPRQGGGSQRAQRALPEDAQDSVDRQSPPAYQFPEAEFGGFVPMKGSQNRRY